MPVSRLKRIETTQGDGYTLYDIHSDKRRDRRFIITQESPLKAVQLLSREYLFFFEDTPEGNRAKTEFVEAIKPVLRTAPNVESCSLKELDDTPLKAVVVPTVSLKRAIPKSNTIKSANDVIPNTLPRQGVLSSIFEQLEKANLIGSFKLGERLQAEMASHLATSYVRM